MTLTKFWPATLTLAYPFLLHAFSGGVGATGLHEIAAWFCLIAAASVPLVGLAWAYRLRRASQPQDFRVRARALAFMTVAAPPLFVFIGVTRGLIGRPLTDEMVWVGVWLVTIACVLTRRVPADVVTPVSARLRVVHGISASLIVIFVVFHLGNHLSGLMGPDVHASIMKAGRTIYRSAPIEVLLIGLLLFQIITGVTLATRWSRRPGDGFRVLQIGSGLYLASFIVTHLNSALVGARAVRHIETDWAWASGGAEGLIYDSWNIRLVPHYGWGVFFVLTHLMLGLRQVLVAHRFDAHSISRLWAGGIAASAAVALAIMSGLLGFRI